MKKFFTLKFLTFSLMLFLTTTAGAQTLYFCESVDDDGYPVNESSTFIIGRNGGYFDFLVRLPYDLNSYYVNYDIYEVNYDGSETFSTTIKQETKPSWDYFWKEITFYDAGTYKVYVYDDDDYLITSAKVKIKFK